MTLGRDTAITYLGHSTFRLQSPGGKQILIDPWVMTNPMCPDNLKNVDDLDLVLITHGHMDHFADALPVLQASGATAVGMFEVAAWLNAKGIENAIGMNKGGSQQVEGITITAVHADHSSAIQDGEQTVYGGEACGYVIEFENGFTIYNTGDTALFGDMRLIAEMHQPDLLMLPIGDHFTMGPAAAAQAIRLTGATRVLPMHYGTFPLLTGTPEKLRELTTDIPDLQIYDIKPGEKLV